jgi:hypothetical protein
MGFLGLKSTLIPMDIARVNESERSIEVSETKDHVRNAPSFDDDEDITPDYEDRIRSYFGLESLGTPESGYGAYTSTGGEHVDSEREEAQAYDTDDDSTDYRSSADPEHGESAGESSESGASISSTGSSADEMIREAPATRHTEETESIQEGGRTKIRRRVIREEIIEEDDPQSQNT